MSDTDEEARFLARIANDPAMTDDHKAVADALCRGNQPGDGLRDAADHLVDLGHLARKQDGTYEALAGDPKKWRPR